MIDSRVLFAGALAMGLSGAVFAQTAQDADYTSVVRAGDSGAGYQMRASDILGMNVQNHAGETIGEVDDLILTGDDSIAQAVLSVGGFLGIGDRLVAVPYDELQFGADREYVVYDATQEQLEARPEFSYMEGEDYGRDRYQNMFESTRTEVEQTAAEATAAAGAAVENTTQAVSETADEVGQETSEAAAEVSEEVSDEGIWDQIAGNWKQFKGQVKQQWGELTDDELDVMEGRRDEMVGKIQEKYGIAKEEAEEQVDSWAAGLE